MLMQHVIKHILFIDLYKLFHLAKRIQLGTALCHLHMTEKITSKE